MAPELLLSELIVQNQYIPPLKLLYLPNSNFWLRPCLSKFTVHCDPAKSSQILYGYHCPCDRYPQLRVMCTNEKEWGVYCQMHISKVFRHKIFTFKGKGTLHTALDRAHQDGLRNHNETDYRGPGLRRLLRVVHTG